jgi:hypothetical protein
MNRPARVLALLLTAVTLSACVNIPSEGPVVNARRVEAARGGGIQLLPAGPTFGSTPAQLVREFLRAAAAFRNDHEVARSFLVTDQRVSWKSDSPVIVYAGEEALAVSVTQHGVTLPDPPPAATSTPPAATPAATPAVTPDGRAGPTSEALTGTPAIGDQATVTVQTPVQARIDAAGQYTVSPPGDAETRRFELVGTSEGWRIVGLDDGILVTRIDFDSTFQDLPVYFADPTGSYLVPDVRWFPVYGTTSVPTAMVSALLRDPVTWLRPGVVSGVPPGTDVTVNAVKVVDDVATVDLTSQARLADPRQRLMLKGQLEQTLFALSSPAPTVTSVVVTVDQQKFELQVAGPTTDAKVAGDGSGQLRPPPKIDPRPVVIDAKGAIARLSGRTAVPVEGLSGVAGPALSAPATETGGTAYAVLADNRTRLLYAVPSGPVVTLVVGRDLLPPSFDPFGWVWSGQQESGGLVLAGKPSARVARVRAPWLAGSALKALRISREGARAVLILQRTGHAPEVYVAAVVRDRDGVPQELGNPMPLLPDAVDATSVSWVDATHVVVLGRRAGSAPMPWIVEIGGDAASTLPGEGVWISAGNSENELYLQTASGQVRARLGFGWTDVPGVRWPTLPG